MKARLCGHAGVAAALLPAAWLFAGAGCVASRYQPAPVADSPPPPVAFELAGTGPAASATVHTVIVFHGPGSWKRDAYWDEYVLTVRCPGPLPITLERVTLVGGSGELVAPGRDPWTVDSASRAQLKVARRTGRNIALGAGAGAAWLGSLALFASNLTLCGGAANSTAAAIGAGGVVALPLVAVGSGVRSWLARERITREFHRRRIDLPAPLPAGAARSGSVFFPVTPAPARMVLDVRDRTGAHHELVIDLAPLRGLHLAPAPTAGPPAPRRAEPSREGSRSTAILGGGSNRSSSQHG